MKIIKSTNMMSTIGVTFISDWRPLPPPAAIPIPILLLEIAANENGHYSG
jgi:hypothetical protein